MHRRRLCAFVGIKASHIWLQPHSRVNNKKKLKKTKKKKTTQQIKTRQHLQDVD